MDETPPKFDWPAEHAGLKRDLSRHRTEINRLISAGGTVSQMRKVATGLRERWDRLVLRLEARWLRGGDAWERQSEIIDRQSAELAQAQALSRLDSELTAALDIDECLAVFLRGINDVAVFDGALVHLGDAGGQPVRAATARRARRAWPPAADVELADYLLAGAAGGRRVIIEGRPVGRGAREQNRIAHWLAIGIGSETSHYGALCVGRRTTEDPFSRRTIRALGEACERLARVLSVRVGAGVRPVFGVGTKPRGFEHLWGESPAFRRALSLAATLASSDSPVLIEGEIGTGRESLARVMHAQSPRSKKPFVVLRGTDLPGDIVAKQLFGVREMRDDGTQNERPGDLEMAAGGTLYFDELAAIDNVLQVQLVRFLQERTFERVGDRASQTTNTRLMFGTTLHLEDGVAQGRIREDLYYLLTAARVVLPPLRERAGDIVELARRFAVAAGERAGKTINGIDHTAAQRLSAAVFPGNVRQLSQVIERAVYLAEGPLLSADDLPDEDSAPIVAAPVDVTTWVEAAASSVRAAVDAGHAGHYDAFVRARDSVRRVVDSAFVAAVRKAVGPQPARAARHLGIHRAQWWRVVRESDEQAGGRIALDVTINSNESDT